MGLNTRQSAAVMMLLAGRSVRASARELGVNEHTITRWRRMPAFQEELNEQKKILLSVIGPRRPG